MKATSFLGISVCNSISKEKKKMLLLSMIQCKNSEPFTVVHNYMENNLNPFFEI